MNLRTIIWAAVSTKEQAQNEKESIPAQIEQARQAIKERGWREVAEPLVVPGQSRNINWLDQAMSEIPQMAQLVEIAEAGKIDLVVVRDWDRLARTESLRVQISTRLREQGVQVYSLNQPVEPQEPSEFKEGTDTALIVESMTGVMSEIENRLRRRRHKIGMLGRVRKGYWCGSPAPYGYRYKAGDRILTINPEEAEIVRLIFRLCHEGKSNRQIVRHLNLLGIPTPGNSEAWRASTIHLVVRRSTYAGYNPYGDQLFEGKHEAIIDRAFWHRIQDQISLRATLKGRSVASEKLFIGLARCGHCGGAMASIRDFYKDHVYISYYCARHKDTGGTSCRPNYKSERKIAQAVLQTLMKYANDPQLFSEVLKAKERETKEEIQRQRQVALEELSKVEDRKARQFIAYERAEITLEEYAEHRSRLESEIAELERIVAETETRLREGLLSLNLEVALRDVVERWEELDKQFLKERFREFFEHLLIYEDGTIEIVWRK